MMSSAFSQADLTAAQPYWYERIPYTFAVTNLAPSGSVPLFTVRGWNGAGGAPTTLATLRELEMDPWSGLQAVVTADTQQYRVHAGSLRGRRPTTGDWAAVRLIGVALTNQTGATNFPSGPLTYPVVRGRYQMAIWQMPAFEKLLRGTGLSPTDTDYLTALGFSTNPVDQKGWYPVPLSAVIERTYANRQIAPPLAYAESVQAPAEQTPLITVPAATNQLLVLRRLAAVATPEAGVTLTVDRDNTLAHVQVAADQLGREGVECFVPALNHLTLKIQATAPPASLVPVRMEVWVLSLSNVLRTRLGLLTEAGLQRLLGTAAGTKFYEDVQVGVN